MKNANNNAYFFPVLAASRGCLRMLPFAILGIILWVLLLLWTYNTTAVGMPVEEEEALLRSMAAKGDFRDTQPPHPGETFLSTLFSTSTQREDDKPQTSSASGGLEARASDNETLRASSEINSEKPSSPPSAEKPRQTHAPMLGSGAGLKFILGASEDYSSDEEPLVTKPPSGASQPPTPNHKCSARSQSSSTAIK